MFEAEALGLGAMYETGTIRVPKPYKVRMFNISVVRDTIYQLYHGGGNLS